MKQARFEQQYRPLWESLEQQLEQLEALRVSRKKRLPLDRFVADYRQLCHQLALARERTYSLELQQYLNNLVLRAHRQLYRYNPPLADRIGAFFAHGFPAAVRRNGSGTWSAPSVSFCPSPSPGFWCSSNRR